MAGLFFVKWTGTGTPRTTPIDRKQLLLNDLLATDRVVVLFRFQGRGGPLLLLPVPQHWQYIEVWELPVLCMPEEIEVLDTGWIEKEGRP